MVVVKKGSHLPITPSNPYVEGKAAEDEQSTKAQDGKVTISAVVDDPDSYQPVRLVVYYSSNNFQTQKGPIANHDWDAQKKGKGVRDSVTLTGLKVNTLYKARLYSQSKVASGPGPLSPNYNGVSFWTNRAPVVAQVSPSQNQEIQENQDFLFDWSFTDPDSGDNQINYWIEYKPVTSPTWIAVTRADQKDGKNSFRLMHAKDLVANNQYVWRVKAADEHGLWSDFSIEQSFYIRGLFTPPRLLDPVGGIGRGVVVTSPVRFTWKFMDPTPTDRQYQADIRWRALGATGGFQPGDEGWFMLRGGGDIPGTRNQWDVQPGYFTPGIVYEWQVRTYDAPARLVPSGWSASGSFVATGTPGAAAGTQGPVGNPETQGALGCGTHRVFVYDRGGRVLRGEITPLVNVQWSRKRDDIANALITTNEFSYDCCALLGDLRSWMHELVIYRDDVRVFEGPITRITYTATDVEIEAKDVMAYLYRRIMRQGYNDAYQRIDLTPLTPSQPLPSTAGGPYLITGQSTVVRRAAQITINALAYQDPNVLPYLTIIEYANDATNSRVVEDYSRTAWEEIDDLAATAGLDYVAVGRRIMYWDTHRSIGRLPEMRDGDFTDPVIVTEYGMQTANFFAVTNNSGQWGGKIPASLNNGNWSAYYGPVEMLASGYGEKEGDAVSSEALTPQAVAALTANYEEQARRNVSHRWPTPLVVRVPDNSTLNPDINLGINQLVPGVWIPLRATRTCRNVSQWQKLDQVTVEETDGAEQIKVTMSPAPNGGDDDPDASAAAEAD